MPLHHPANQIFGRRFGDNVIDDTRTISEYRTKTTVRATHGVSTVDRPECLSAHRHLLQAAGLNTASTKDKTYSADGTEPLTSATTVPLSITAADLRSPPKAVKKVGAETTPQRTSETKRRHAAVIVGTTAH